MSDAKASRHSRRSVSHSIDENLRRFVVNRHQPLQIDKGRRVRSRTSGLIDTEARSTISSRHRSSVVEDVERMRPRLKASMEGRVVDIRRRGYRGRAMWRAGAPIRFGVNQNSRDVDDVEGDEYNEDDDYYIEDDKDDVQREEVEDPDNEVSSRSVVHESVRRRQSWEQSSGGSVPGGTTSSARKSLREATLNSGSKRVDYNKSYEERRSVGYDTYGEKRSDSSRKRELDRDQAERAESLLSESLMEELKEITMDDDPRDDWIYQWLLFVFYVWIVTLGVVTILSLVFDPPHKPKQKETRTSDFKLCDEIVCRNGATCVQWTKQRWTCECEPGYFGKYCQETASNLKFCKSSPCLNNGVCKETFFGFKCSCPSGSRGHRCEIDIDDCRSSPCFFGECVDLLGGFVCICNTQGQTPDPNFQDHLCKTDSRRCADNPCENGASCTDGIAITKSLYRVVYKTVKRIELSFNYNCSCEKEFTGPRCELPNKCEGVNCGEGTCITLSRIPGDEKGDEFFCDCKSNPATRNKIFDGQKCLARTPCSTINCPKFYCHHSKKSLASILTLRPKCEVTNPSNSPGRGKCRSYKTETKKQNVSFCYAISWCETTGESPTPNCVYKAITYQQKVDSLAGGQTIIDVPLRCESEDDCRDPVIHDDLPENLDPTKCHVYNCFAMLYESLQHGVPMVNKERRWRNLGESLIRPAVDVRYHLPDGLGERWDRLRNPPPINENRKFSALGGKTIREFNAEKMCWTFSRNIELNDIPFSKLWPDHPLLLAPDDPDSPSRLDYFWGIKKSRRKIKRVIKLCESHVKKSVWEVDDNVVSLMEDSKCMQECSRAAGGTCDACFACARNENPTFKWDSFDNSACKREVDQKDRARCCKT